MSLDSQPIENIITRELVKDSLKVDDWITKKFKEKKESKIVGHGVAVYKDPFISYLAEESELNYVIESVVCFINLPNKLEAIDEDIFEYIKDNVIQKVDKTDEESGENEE
ncbi:hypothetical protein D3C72_2145280 [compost metagenome]